MAGTSGTAVKGGGVKVLSEKVHIEELKTIDELEQDQKGSELAPFMGQDQTEMLWKFLGTQT